MIAYETHCQIRLLHDQRQLTASQIAAELQLDIKTVEKWIGRETFAPRKSPKRSSKLDAFKNQIIALHLTHRQDLLDLDIPAPDLALYEPKPKP